MNILSCAESPQILALDVAGRPSRWIDWQDAVILYVRERIAWEAGESHILVRGGRSRLSGLRSELIMNSIVAVAGHAPGRQLPRVAPALSNRALFHRDENLCLYCGTRFAVSLLTRDHVVPRAQHGEDGWENVATACGPCNLRKGARTPEQAGMPLLAVPYAPDVAEWLILSNRRILADQMRFLKRG